MGREHGTPEISGRTNNVHYVCKTTKVDSHCLGNVCTSQTTEGIESIKGGIFTFKVTDDIPLQGERNITLETHVPFDKFPLNTGAQAKVVPQCVMLAL